MKKILLGLGTLAAVAAPVATVVACGDSTKGISMDLTGVDQSNVQTKLESLMEQIKSVVSKGADAVNFNIKDGDRKLVLKLNKDMSQDDASKDMQDLMNFFKTSFTDRGLDTAALGSIFSQL